MFNLFEVHYVYRGRVKDAARKHLHHHFAFPLSLATALLPSLLLPTRLSLDLSLSHTLYHSLLLSLFSLLLNFSQLCSSLWFCLHLLVSWFFFSSPPPYLPPSPLPPKLIPLVFLIFFTVSPPPLCLIFSLSFTKQAAGSLLSILSNSSDSRRLFLYIVFFEQTV